MSITDHAYKRGKERFKFNKQTLDKMALIAFEKGLTHSDTKGRLNKYLTKLWFDYKTCNNVRIYGEVIYFFKDDLLITLYGVPNELKKNVKVCKK